MVGVNGSGKTTTIGKLAKKFTDEGKTLMLAAGDTFRAAAIEQLKIWGARNNAPVISREPGADAAGLAFDAIKTAQEQNIDILLMDTAGRLQNRTELMAELDKIVRVMAKVDPEAPHAVLLVLDATVGQNALSQVEIFGKVGGRDRSGDDQARRHRARRHPCRHSGKIQPCPCISSASANRPTTWSRSPPAISPAPSRALTSDLECQPTRKSIRC